MYIYGASGHARVMIDLIEDNEIIHGIFDDNPDISTILDYPVLGPFCYDRILDAPLFIAIGDNVVRYRIANRLSKETWYGKVVHRSAIISKRAVIDKGTVVMEGVIIKVNCEIGKQAIINTGASIDHDCIIGDFVHIAPQTTLCGGITIGEGSLIGANSIILPGVTIGSWCKIAAGSTVHKDVPDGNVWIGRDLKSANLMVNSR
ncbi:acetyltransferase [Pararhodonellum marinum]|uniref:acetyltransferase n=1 Tax=Pararhodonellum marinum TaxID=2755358 RepID=UPI0018903EC9|nr:acetyltransferase [Pararhodonellum marinum]